MAMPASCCFKIAITWLSVNRNFFIDRSGCFHHKTLYLKAQLISGGLQLLGNLIKLMVPILGRRSDRLVPFGPSADDCASYVGSVYSNGRELSCSSPRAGAIFRTLDGERWGNAPMLDACAIGGGLAQSGFGKARLNHTNRRFPWAWDNHLQARRG